jgi:hypothetical protein
MCIMIKFWHVFAQSEVEISSIGKLGHWANVPSDAVLLPAKSSLWTRAQHPCCPNVIEEHEINSSHLAQHPLINIGVAI